MNRSNPVVNNAHYRAGYAGAAEQYNNAHDSALAVVIPAPAASAGNMHVCFVQKNSILLVIPVILIVALPRVIKGL